jgi:hypothetical protein
VLLTLSISREARWQLSRTGRLRVTITISFPRAASRRVTLALTRSHGAER